MRECAKHTFALDSKKGWKRMLKIGKFFEEKVDALRNGDDREYKNKLLFHKASVLKRMILTIAVIVIVGIGIYVFFKNKVYTNYNVISVVEREDSVNTKYLEYEDGILKYSNDGISFTDYNNNAKWNVAYEMQNPRVDISGSYVAAADLKGNKIYIMNTSGAKGEIDTALPIQQIEVASQGVVYAVMEDDTDIWIFTYNYDGTVLAKSKQPMATSGYPIDIAVSPNGEKLMVSYLYVDSGVMKTDIAFYNYGSVGQNESDNLVSGYTYDGIVFPMVEFLTESVSVAIGDSKVAIYTGNQKPQLLKEIECTEEILSAYYSKEHIGIVFNNDDDADKYRMDIYNLAGEKVLSKKFSYDYTDILLDESGFIIVNEGEFAAYSMAGIEKFHYKSNNTLLSVFRPESSGKFVIVDSKNTQFIGLKLN